MARRARVAAGAAGVLCANALPHLVTAAAGWRMLTLLAGRDSPAPVNAVWRAMNLADGLLLLRAGARGDEDATALREAFGLGAAAFTVWGLVGERLFAFTPARDDLADPR